MTLRFSFPGRRALAVVATLSGLLGLAGCAGEEEVGVLTCPQVFVVQDASVFVQYAEGDGRDIIDERVKGRIVNVEWLCTFLTDQNRVDMEVRFAMRARLGQASVMAGVDRARFPYFVAVADPQGQILAKQVFAIDIGFPGNTREVAHVESVLQRIGYANIAQAARYTVYIGFQLDRAQLEEARRATDL